MSKRFPMPLLKSPSVPLAHKRVAEDEPWVAFSLLRPSTSRDTFTAQLEFGLMARNEGHRSLVAIGDQVRGRAPAGFALPGWDMLCATGHPCLCGPSAVGSHWLCQCRALQGHQLPLPETRSWPVTSKGFSPTCSPRNPLTSCTGSPRWHLAPRDPLLPTAAGRQAAVRQA